MWTEKSLAAIQIVSASEKVDDFVYDLILNKKENDSVQDFQDKYFKLRRHEELITTAWVREWDKFSFEKAKEEGILCENDYNIFDELKGL